MRLQRGRGHLGWHRDGGLVLGRRLSDALRDPGHQIRRDHRPPEARPRLTLSRLSGGSVIHKRIVTVGTPLEPSNVSGRLHRLLAAAGLPRQRFHDVRHCFATAMLTEGVGARSVMEMLGHSQISLTLNTDAHVMPETLRDAAATLDAAFERQGGTGHGPSA